MLHINRNFSEEEGMAVTVGELREWLSIITDEKHIAVDDGGLALVIVESAMDSEATESQDFEESFEIGGIPLNDSGEIEL